MFRATPKPSNLLKSTTRRVGTTMREERPTMPPLKTDPPGGKPPMIGETAKFLAGAATVSTLGYFAYAHFNPRRQPNYRPDAKAPDTKEAIDSAMNKSIVPPMVTISDPSPEERGKFAAMADTVAAGPSSVM
ncbi:unnamed protein product, partial [Mesorhabditis belari]|uniref:Uncharacterized protein n=1 Tax=Mesorhabditis belari TaxID=2138241 RepID=A0AAF3EST6_9BILA